MALFLLLKYHLILFIFGFYINTNGPFLPVTAILNIEIPGPFLNITIPPPLKLLVQQNSLALIPCTVSIDNIIVKRKSDYDLDIIWYKNNKKLIIGKQQSLTQQQQQQQHQYNGNNELFIIYDNGTLKLPTINENISGVYRCLVNGTNRNLGVLISTESIVTYAVLKRLPKTKSNIIGKIGIYLRLDCPFDSVPKANITWKFKNYTTTYKYGFQMINDRIFQLENGSLIINSVTDTDKGKYKCIAENRFASKSSRQSIIILSTEYPDHNNTLPSMMIGSLLPPLQDQILYVPIGNNLKLHCLIYNPNKNANLSSIKRIEWWYLNNDNNNYAYNDNDYEHDYDVGIPIKIHNHSNEINLINLSIEQHNGTYKCSTDIDSQIFHVIVTEPPSIEQPLKSYERALAATVSLSCKASGNPPPEIIWYRNGLQLHNTYTVHYIQPFLRIYSLDLIDEGIYQCFAKNIAGQQSTTGQIKLRNRKDLMNIPKRPENIKCYPIDYKTLNITFDSKSEPFMMNIHVVTENPFKWNSTMPVQVQSNSYVIVNKGLPILKPFTLFLRGLVATSIIQTSTGIDQTFDPSLLSDGVKCATQGLQVNGVFFPNGIFIWWPQLNFLTIKYYVIQIKNNKELNNNNNNKNDTTKNLFKNNIIIGTTKPIDIYNTKNDIEKILYKIPIINNDYNIYHDDNNNNNNKNNNDKNELYSSLKNHNNKLIETNNKMIKNNGAINDSEPTISSSTSTITTTTITTTNSTSSSSSSSSALSSLFLSSILSSSSSSLSSTTADETDSVINLVVPGNVTGILIPNITNLTVRVIVITDENENLIQDLRYLEWKTIENSTTKTFIFRVTNIESRNINFAWNSLGGISCIKVCYNSLNIDAIIRDEQQKYCQQINDGSSQFSIRKLKPLTTYRMDFIDCYTMHHLGSTEIQTKPDLPGPIQNQRIFKNGGLNLIWDPPINPNGKLLYYLINWTHNNNTYEANVTTDTDRFFKFPNVTESDKINASIRVIGSSGIGPPIYIDLRNVETDILDNEKVIVFDHTLGIIIGVLLSIICIIVFICLFIRQRSRFKKRRHITTSSLSRTSPSEQNFSTTPIPASIELHEMQTLIPPVQHQQQHHHNFHHPHYQRPLQQQVSRQTNFDIQMEINEMNGLLPYHHHIIPNGNGIFYGMKSTANDDNDDHLNILQNSNHNRNDDRQQIITESTTAGNIYCSTPLIKRKSIANDDKNTTTDDFNEIFITKKSLKPLPSLPSTSLQSRFVHNDDNDDINDITDNYSCNSNNSSLNSNRYHDNHYNNDLNNLSSSPTLLNFSDSKLIKNSNSNLNSSNPLINLQNGSIKTLLPPNKHSISSFSNTNTNTNTNNTTVNTDSNESIEVSLNSIENQLTDNLKKSKELKVASTDSNVTTSNIIFDKNQQNPNDNDENSKTTIKHQKNNENYENENENDDNIISNDNNITAITFVNMNDTKTDDNNTTNNKMKTFDKTNWSNNYNCRPIIDPNG